MLRRFAADAAPNHIQQALLRSLQETGEISVASLRALSPFQEDAQKLIDQAVVEVGLSRLVLAQDLLAAGLTFPLANAMSIMELQWEKVSKTGGAQRTMSPSARGENQAPARVVKRIPIYLTMDDFSVGIRVFQMAQRIGTPIDTSLIKDATRRVNESIEDACINGADLQVAGNTVPGLLTAPNANTETLSVDWTAANVVGTTGPAMVNDVLAMIDELQSDHKYGPYNLYLGTKAGTVLEGDFKANTTDTIRERLARIQAGGRALSVRVADMMPNAATGQQAAVVQMTSEVIELVDGQRPVVIPWTSADGFTLYWAVLAIMVPRVRDDYDTHSGVCIGSKS